MKINQEMIVRTIGGETVLVPLGDSLRDNNGLFMLSETGRFIWDILPECENQKAAEKRLLEEYDVSPETAEKDVSEFFSSLRNFGIID